MKLQRYIVTLMGLLFLSLASAADVKPVPAELIDGNRLVVPKLGFSIARPNADWQWMQADNPVGTAYQLINRKAGSAFVLLIVDRVEQPLNDAFVQDFLDGAQEAAKGDGVRLVNISATKATIPNDSSYRFGYRSELPDGRSIFLSGYLVKGDNGRVFILQEVRGREQESASFRPFVQSLRFIPNAE